MKNKREFIIAFISLTVGVILAYFILQNRIIGLKKQIYQSPKTQITEPISPNPSLKAAIELIKQKGFTVYNSSSYDPSSPFNVLVGMCTGSADGYCNKAFFFYKGKYVGTDTEEPSIDVGLKWAGGDTIALEYILYRKDDSLCCSTAGAALVRFKWDGAKLKALDPIPTSDWFTDFHR